MSLLVTADTSRLKFLGPSIPALDQPWSLSFWYYHNTDIGAGGAYRTIVVQHSGFFANFMAVTVSGGTLLLWRYDVGGVGNIVGTTITSGWHHISYRNIDNVSAELYLDGVLAISFTQAPGSFLPNSIFTFAEFGGDPSFSLYEPTAREQARIEDVKILLGATQPDPFLWMHAKHPPAYVDSWVPLIEGRIGTEDAIDILGFGNWDIVDMIYAHSAPQSYGEEASTVLMWPAPQILSPGGISSSETFGGLAFAHSLTFGGIASSEGVGGLAFAHRISWGGIASAEALGGLAFSHSLSFGGIAPAEAVGSLTFSHVLVLAGIPSDEGVGSLSFVHVLVIGGVPSAEAVGGLSLLPTIVLPGIGSEEAVGSLALARVIFPAGIGSAEAFGSPTLSFFVAEALTVWTLRARRGEVSSPARIGSSTRRRARSGSLQAALRSAPAQLHALHAGGVVGKAQKI